MSKTKTKKKIVDGKIEDFQPTTLDQIWGEDSNTNYKARSVKEYEQQLAEMNTADLQAHAVKVGILPTESRERTVRKLTTEFASYLSQLSRIPKTTVKPKDVPKQIMDILSEGR